MLMLNKISESESKVKDFVVNLQVLHDSVNYEDYSNVMTDNLTQSQKVTGNQTQFNN